MILIPSSFANVFSHRDETLEALSDAQYVAPAAQTVDLHSQDHRNSFLYVFDYQTKFGDYAQVCSALNIVCECTMFTMFFVVVKLYMMRCVVMCCN